jgi:hypothetical protein
LKYYEQLTGKRSIFETEDLHVALGSVLDETVEYGTVDGGPKNPDENGGRDQGIYIYMNHHHIGTIDSTAVMKNLVQLVCQSMMHICSYTHKYMHVYTNIYKFSPRYCLYLYPYHFSFYSYQYYHCGYLVLIAQ